jgi:hypothetical protein
MRHKKLQQTITFLPNYYYPYGSLNIRTSPTYGQNQQEWTNIPECFFNLYRPGHLFPDTDKQLRQRMMIKKG